MSEAQVMIALRTTDSRAELLMRRLRQWQRIVRFPADSRQVLTVLFGSLDGLEEDSTFAPTGRIASNANPRAKQFEQDVGAVQYLRNGPEFIATHSLFEILTAPSVGKKLCSFNPTLLRKVPELRSQAQSRRTQNHPPEETLQEH
eukprot:5408345-Pyramimonas_sp.AAC.1